MIKLTIGDKEVTINDNGELVVEELETTNKDKELLANLKNQIEKNLSALRERIAQKEEEIKQTKGLMELAGKMCLEALSGMVKKDTLDERDYQMIKGMKEFADQLNSDLQKLDNN